MTKILENGSEANAISPCDASILASMVVPDRNMPVTKSFVLHKPLTDMQQSYHHIRREDLGRYANKHGRSLQKKATCHPEACVLAVWLSMTTIAQCNRARHSDACSQRDAVA